MKSIEDAQQQLAGAGYIADRRLATAVFLSLELARPLFLEGEAGVGSNGYRHVAGSICQPVGQDSVVAVSVGETQYGEGGRRH